MTETLAKSDVVVIARLSQFLPDDLHPVPFRPQGGEITPEQLERLSEFQGAGLYHFQVVQRVRGVLPDVVNLHLPPLSRVSYRAPFATPPGRLVLLLLRSTPEGLAPTDSQQPFIPLPAATGLPLAQAEIRPLSSTVITLLLDCVGDPELRVMAVHALRVGKFVDARIPPVLRTFAIDP